MGLDASSNDSLLVGRMTSGGTDVIEMPASTSRSTIGVSIEVSVDASVDTVSMGAGRVEEGVVTTVVGESAGAIDDAVGTGAADEVGNADGRLTLEAHSVDRSARTTSHRPKWRNDCEFTLSPLQARYCRHSR